MNTDKVTWNAPLAPALSPFGGEREKIVAFGLRPNRIEPQARHYNPLAPPKRGEGGAERRVRGTIQFLYLSVSIRVHPWLK
jgi:hypothetical protein